MLALSNQEVEHLPLEWKLRAPLALALRSNHQATVSACAMEGVVCIVAVQVGEAWDLTPLANGNWQYNAILHHANCCWEVEPLVDEQDLATNHC